jgi:hypothetical protein
LNFLRNRLNQTFYEFIKTKPSNPNPAKPEPKIFATKSQGHKDFYFLFFFSVLGPLWREEKSFSIKSTKFTTKETKTSE